MKIHREIYFAVSELSQISLQRYYMSLRQYFTAVEVYVQVTAKHEDVTFELTKYTTGLAINACDCLHMGGAM